MFETVNYEFDVGNEGLLHSSHVTIQCQSLKEVTDWLRLCIKTDTPIITLSGCPVAVNETDSYLCTCTAVGNPTPAVMWYPRDSSVNQILDFPAINRNKAGQYTCNATSSSPKFGTLQTQSVLNLVVQYAPDVELLVQNAMEHDTHLVMTCNASGVPNVYTYGVWTQIFGTTLLRTITGDVSTHGRTLTLDIVTYQDIGTYICRVHNSLTGRDSQLTQTGTAVFDVRGSPRLLTGESLYITEKNQHLNITMTFISHPSPTDMYISNTARLSSTTEHKITFMPGTVSDKIYGKVILRDGYRVHLDFPFFLINQEGAYSVTVINHVNPNLMYGFQIVIVDVPDTPTDLIADEITTDSAVVSWTPGMNRGRENQTFHLWIKESSAESWTKYNTPQTGMVISDLQAASTFVVLLFAANEKGRSNNMTLQFTTLSGVQSPVAPIIGGISGGIIGLLCIAIAIVLYRRMSNDKNKCAGNRSDAAPFNNDRDDDGDDGKMKMNILYESAGPYRPEDQEEHGQPENEVTKKTAAGAVYAEVKKKTPAGAVYAEVVPKKDRKAAEGNGDVYAEVQKSIPDVKTKKQAGNGKKKGETVYENAGAVAGKPEELYANADGTVVKNGPKESRRKNQDGLVYLDLEFQQKQDGTRQAVIHGIENRNDYSIVDFTKHADPLPAEGDDEKKEDGKN